MRKNGSRFISLKQYRLADLFLFALILVIFDLVVRYALVALSGGADFVFSITVPVVLLVMMRWGWQCVFFAVGEGILYSLLYNMGMWQSYIVYPAGNCFMLLLLVFIKLVGKQKIVQKSYLTLTFTVLGWALQNLGLTLAMWALFGGDFAFYLLSNFGIGVTGLMSLAAAVVILFIMRRLDGMFEDQVQFIKRTEKERREMQRRDEFGDEPIEIDDETLSILNKRDDGLGK